MIVVVVAGACWLTGCAEPPTSSAPIPALAAGGSRPEVIEFLTMYSLLDQRLSTVSAEADWSAVTDVNEQHTGERIGAGRALAAFRGSRYVIDRAKTFLDKRDGLTETEFNQLDHILLAAAESPGTIPDIVSRRVETEARAAATLDGFTFCLEKPVADGKCPKPVTPNQIDEVLAESRNLAERAKMWEVSKQVGPALKPSLVELRDLRNRVAREMGYSSYFHLQVADYGLTVPEMMQLMDKTVTDLRPLYEQLHLWTRTKLAERYKQPVPESTLPAHWVGNRWAQAWPGLVESAGMDDLFQGKQPEWIVKQAERFYTSLGMPALPKSFWEKSDLYELPPDSPRKKNTHASAWHIDTNRDVRALMSVKPNAYWFETTHHELGHVYYFLAYSNPNVPHVLREGANRAFHEAVGDLISIAARQPQYLTSIGLLPEDRKPNLTERLMAEALDNAVVFIPFAAGTMTNFEHDLYEKKLPESSFNRRWWELTRKYQGVEPPTPRGEQYCDGCTKTHVIDDPAQYYDYAMAFLIKYQLHDYIARKILKQDPHDCNYYGNKEVGKWLWELLSLGATQDWREVIRQRTGEDISSRAMLEYFKPLVEHLRQQNGGRPASWQ
jgi:peptidyl-dipeptidase A